MQRNDINHNPNDDTTELEREKIYRSHILKLWTTCEYE